MLIYQGVSVRYHYYLLNQHTYLLMNKWVHFYLLDTLSMTLHQSIHLCLHEHTQWICCRAKPFIIPILGLLIGGGAKVGGLGESDVGLQLWTRFHEKTPKTYPLVNVYIAMERSTIFMGKLTILTGPSSIGLPEGNSGKLNIWIDMIVSCCISILAVGSWPSFPFFVLFFVSLPEGMVGFSMTKSCIPNLRNWLCLLRLGYPGSCPKSITI